MNTLWLSLLAVLSGIAFSGIGMAYRMGERRGVSVLHTAMFMGFGGTVFFVIRSLGTDLSTVPRAVWVVGIIVGLTQYLLPRLIEPALKRGPLVPVWCAVNLNFLLPVLLASLFLGETSDWMQKLGLCTGALTVVFAALNAQATSPKTASPPDEKRSHPHYFVYGALLMGIVLLSGALPAGLKLLQHSNGDLMAQYGSVFYALMYAHIGALLFIDLAITGRLWRVNQLIWVFGPMATGSSIIGVSLMWLALALPAAALFTIVCSVSLLSAAIVSVLFLGERTRPAWYMTLALAIATVVLANLGAILK